MYAQKCSTMEESSKLKLKEQNNFDGIKFTAKTEKNENTNEDITADYKEQPKKPQRRDKSDLGENFIAPDGGVWAWLVCIAAGVSNLSVYPCLQQFGFIFRERLLQLGMSTSEVTTVINTNSAISACTGLLNGPMFRRFSYRQVAMAGSIFVFLGIALTAFCKTFFGYILSYSLLYGFGVGISVSASALAINTYFRHKRRRATGFSWTITGLGPIFLPHLVTFLLSIYDVRETVLIFAAFSLHTFVSALIYQPVQYHVRNTEECLQTEELAAINTQPEHLCKFCELQQHRERSLFSSQYLYQEDDADMCGYEIIEPATPMLSRANDGWYGSKLSLASHGSTARFRTVSVSKDLENGLTARLNKVSEEGLPTEELLKPNNFNRERDETVRRSSSKLQFNHLDSRVGNHCTCAKDRALLEVQSTILEDTTFEEMETETQPRDVSCLRKLVVFFDLDLLRDLTYVNLVVGLTTINFGELNFSILTPFILHDYKFSTSEMTIATSVLATVDLTTRFLVPFFTEKISWDNRVFFLIGVVGIALGRTIVACTRSFHVIVVTFFVMGIFKGVRTIFWPLIIPSYVPLNRLPAASGLQLLITGLFTLAAGPLVGIIRDRFSYSATIHCLNFMSFFAAFSWILEYLIRRYLKTRTSKS